MSPLSAHRSRSAPLEPEACQRQTTNAGLGLQTAIDHDPPSPKGDGCA